MPESSEASMKEVKLVTEVEKHEGMSEGIK